MMLLFFPRILTINIMFAHTAPPTSRLTCLCTYTYTCTRTHTHTCTIREREFRDLPVQDFGQQCIDLPLLNRRQSFGYGQSAALQGVLRLSIGTQYWVGLGSKDAVLRKPTPKSFKEWAMEQYQTVRSKEARPTLLRNVDLLPTLGLACSLHNSPQQADCFGTGQQLALGFQGCCQPQGYSVERDKICTGCLIGLR